MLMESRVEDSHGAADAKKQRSLDLQTLYDQKPGLPLGKNQNQAGELKRNHSKVDDDSGLARSKSKKEFPLSSLPSGKKIKKSLRVDEVYNGGSSSGCGDLNQVESGLTHKSDDKVNGFDGVSLNVGDDIHQIPKRRRDLVRQKKGGVSNGLKQEGSLGGKVSSNDMSADLNGGSKGKMGQDGGVHGNPDENGNCKGSFSRDADKKVKWKKGNNDQNGTSSTKLDLSRILKKKNGNSHANNGDPSSNKKANGHLKRRKETTLEIDPDAKDARLIFDQSIRTHHESPEDDEEPQEDSHAHSGDPSSNKKAKRNGKRRKEPTLEMDAAAKDAKHIFDQSTRTHGESPEDDEENLEANAARMLSSRFDPSCTRFSSNVKGSNSPGLLPSHRDYASHRFGLQSESSGDADVRVLRPRDQREQKGLIRKRRHFYEVLAKDVDAYWMVERKIKVYWPLDQFWYFGKVIGYDRKKMLHHVKYDDREEEWIDLQNERFKLLLFPSELPFKAGRRGSAAKAKHDVKGKADAEVQDDSPSTSRMDSEPIISWLARSSSRLKSSSVGTSKKHKTSDESEKVCSLSSTFAKGIASECLDIGISQNVTDELLRNPDLPDNSDGMEAGGIEITSKSPIVYFRRRFQRKEHRRADVSDDGLGHFPQEHLVCRTVSHFADSRAVLPDRLHPTDSVEFSQFDDDLVILDLSVPAVNTEMFRCKLNFLPFMLPYYSFGLENLWVFHASLMLQYGTLITLWPRVHLEMLVVDNFVGLRFLLFEGCLVQAIACVFFILSVFHHSSQQRKHVGEHLPVTSIRFQISSLEDVTKQLVFAFYNYCELDTSRWVFLDHMLQKYCFLAKQLPPPECTYDNIKALENGSNHLNVLSISPKHSSRLGLWRRTKQSIVGASGCVSRDDKRARLPPFALSFSAAPTFFLSLHLKLLMECGIPCVNFRDRNSISLLENGVEQVDCCPGECNCSSSLHLCRTKLDDISRNGSAFEQPSWSNPDIGKNGASAVCEDVGMIQKSSHRSEVLGDDHLNKSKGQKMNSERFDSSAQHSSPKDHCPPLEGKTTYCPLNGIAVEIPLFHAQDKPSGGGLHTDQSDEAIHSPTTNASSTWHLSKVGSSLLENLSHKLPDGKPVLIHSGPKKPRTQVSYSLPLEGHDLTTKFRTNHTRGFAHKRIRRAGEKRGSDASGNYQRNMESLSCDVNVLVISGDRGWREGARVVLELVDNEWRLAVKISESTRYAYKPPQFLQAGSTNRYTHAMMWKGGKDWILEFPDRSQWTLFKEMHEECYNRNFRAALVKHIPIPGVRLIDENDDNGVELPFVRPSSRYFRQLQTDVDIAMDPSHVLYDMDSDDELWISKMRSSDVENCGLENVSDEMFEKIMDTLEKVAYAKQQDHFTSDELEELVVEGGPMEAIKIIYEHWLEKRHKKGIPLVRHLQPPLWVRYQQQVKKWESAMSKSNGTVSNGCHEKAIEKPPMFAFCLKPRGLELPNNRLTKHRSQKKLPYTGHVNVISGDRGAFHSYGRRFNGCASGEQKILYHHGSSDSSQPHQASTRLLSPRDAGGSGYFSLNNYGYERIHYPRLHQTKSRKIGTILPPNDQQASPSDNQRFMSKRNGMQAWNTYLHEWPSSRYGQLEGPRRLSIEHLDPSDLDEFRLRDASSAAQHAVNMARLKRENAQRLLYKADLAIHKAMVALMTAEAIKASCKDSTDDASSDG